METRNQKCAKPELPQNPSNVGKKEKKVSQKQNEIKIKSAEAKAVHERDSWHVLDPG
jgi:hypothetical protein